MDLAKRSGSFELVHITGDNPVNGIGAEPFVVKFFVGQVILMFSELSHTLLPMLYLGALCQ